MNEKDKAKELVDKFLNIENCHEHLFHSEDGHICKHIAKQCALIAIDYLIDEESNNYYFYIDVKQEINNL